MESVSIGRQLHASIDHAIKLILGMVNRSSRQLRALRKPAKDFRLRLVVDPRFELLVDFLLCLSHKYLLLVYNLVVGIHMLFSNLSNLHSKFPTEQR